MKSLKILNRLPPPYNYLTESRGHKQNLPSQLRKFGPLRVKKEEVQRNLLNVANEHLF